MERTRKPAWWQLYLTVPLMIVLLLLEARLSYPLVVHRVAEFGIVLVSFGLMAVWMHANQAALVNEEIEKEPWILEPDPRSEVVIDPDILPDPPDDSVERPYHVQVSPNKGRYN